MIFALLLRLAVSPTPSIETLDSLAQAHDVAGLTRYITGLPDGKPNPLDVVKSGGAYGVGRYGWHALALEGLGGRDQYVVLSTPLTSEDIGEFLFRREGERLRLIPEDDPIGVRVVRHDLNVAYDVPKKRARISDRLSLHSEGQGEFVFRMGPAFRVRSIEGPAGKQVPFHQAGGVVLLTKPRWGDATFRIRYEGVVNLPQYAGSISATEATLANDYWYPMIARGPAPYSLTVHCPKGWITVGQGDRLSDEDAPTEHISKFRMDLPVVYFSTSSGAYKTAKVEADGRTFYAWSPRMKPEQLRTQAETYIPIIHFYDQFGRFPFKSYGALDSPAYGGGALEAYSYATYGGGLPSEDPHEPSHTWWGGMIDNTYLHSFWNESFAVFSEGLYARESDIGDRPERRLAFIRDGNVGPGYDRYACSKAGADRGPIASSLGYGKGSQVLQMLEQLMGTRSMIASMHRWVAEQPRGKPGEWEDFERAAEAERPDLHLESFFHDWLDRPGFVDFKASVSYQPGEVEIDLRFVGEPYRIPLEVLLFNRHGFPTHKMFDVSQSGVIKIPYAQRPALVSLDPYRRLLRRISADETPIEIASVRGSLRTYVDPGSSAWARTFNGEVAPFPSDPAGAFLIGSPAKNPTMATLCERAGFRVSGDILTYQGTTIDLRHGAAMAVVDLDDGKHCMIGLGSTRLRPNPGRARLALFDDLGRVLRAKTDPKTSGNLTF